MFWHIFIYAIFNTIQILSLGSPLLFLNVGEIIIIESVFICTSTAEEWLFTVTCLPCIPKITNPLKCTRHGFSPQEMQLCMYVLTIEEFHAIFVNPLKAGPNEDEG